LIGLVLGKKGARIKQIQAETKVDSLSRYYYYYYHHHCHHNHDHHHHYYHHHFCMLCGEQVNAINVVGETGNL